MSVTFLCFVKCLSTFFVVVSFEIRCYELIWVHSTHIHTDRLAVKTVHGVPYENNLALSHF